MEKAFEAIFQGIATQAGILAAIEFLFICVLFWAYRKDMASAWEYNRSLAEKQERLLRDILKITKEV